MCGLFGIILKNKNLYNKKNLIDSLNTLTNRGPDFQNYYEYENSDYKFFFGHTRLSILEPSNLGNQPMYSNSKRYLIIFNGEIYNHLALREIIDTKIKINWKSNSDTETLINFIENFDINFVLENISGMFAFAAYDFKEDKLILSRDLVGEKPLYINVDENFLMFSSELSAFNNLNIFNKKIDCVSVKNYLRLNYIPAPLTIYENTFKIPSSTIIEIDLKKYNFKKYSKYIDMVNDKYIYIRKWWDLKNIKKDSHDYSDSKEILNKIENLIENSTKEQLISDVPIGVFLSGGIDSALILSQISKNKSNIDTFNIGFEFDHYDESQSAKKISEIFNTNHNYHMCSKNDALNMIEKINDAFSEPFADSSQIPTMLVSQIARKKVKVILGGDGGDEIFGGYNRYLLANKYWKYLKYFPKPLNNIFKLNKYIPNNVIFAIFDKFLKLENISKNKISSYKKILNKLSNIHNKESFYENLTVEWRNDEILSNKNIQINNNYNEYADKNLNFEEWMMSVDFNTYLTDDILCKVDRSSMFFGLETRSPFLNKKLIEYVYNIPFEYKINNNITKWSAKKILEKYIPKNLIYKSKQGFGVPLSEWFRKELRDFVFDNLSKSNCDKHNLFNYKEVEKTLENHYKNNIDSEHKIWSLIQFNSWYNKNYF